MAKLIQLTQDKVSVIDDWHYSRIAAMGLWHVYDNGRVLYAVRHHINPTSGRRGLIGMHNCIKAPPVGRTWDHVDGNGLNNQEDNLRLATASQQAMNRKRRNDNTSGYKGVSLHSRLQRWGASIGISGKRIHLGYFDTAEEAALAYNQAAIQYFGEFAKLNNVPLCGDLIDELPSNGEQPKMLDVPEAPSASKPESLQDVKAKTVLSSGVVDLLELVE